MKRTIRILGWPVFIMAMLSLAGLAYNLVFYERLRPMMLRFDDISPVLDAMQVPAAVSFIIIFLFHLIAAVYILIQMMYFKRGSFFLCFFSTSSILGKYIVLF